MTFVFITIFQILIQRTVSRVTTEIKQLIICASYKVLLKLAKIFAVVKKFNCNYHSYPRVKIFKSTLAWFVLLNDTIFLSYENCNLNFQLDTFDKTVPSKTSERLFLQNVGFSWNHRNGNISY